MKRIQPAASLLLLGNVWMLLVGVQCSRSKPSCDAADGGVELQCPAEQVRACIDRCVPVGNPGDDCNVDPCVSDLICPNGTTCIRDVGDEGKCEPTASGLILGCEEEDPLGSYGYCSSNTYCASFEACGMDRPTWLEDAEGGGICVLPLGEGSLCNSDWTALIGGAVQAEACRACEAGTQCLASAALDGERICQRPCRDDGDCPCGVECNKEEGFCDVPCLENHQECTVGTGLTCCDSSCLTAYVPDLVGDPHSVQVCCEPTNSDCVTDDECCPDAECHGGKCTPCGSYPGADPTTGAGCCEALGMVHDVEGGVCRRGCPLAEAGALCPESADCPGVYILHQCDPVLGDICVDPVADGRSLGDPCVSTQYSTCYGSATGYATIRGTMECGPTGLFCKADIGIDVCTAPGGICGGGLGCVPQTAPPYSCTTDAQCAPGYGCRATTFGAGGADGGFGGITGRGCIPCGEPGPTCWHPGANSSGCEIEPIITACSP